MIRIALGSTNPVKLEAARLVAARVWPGVRVEPVIVPSGVSVMPLSDTECIVGARNRAIAARDRLRADYGLGIEGGVQSQAEGLMLTAWAVMVDGANREGVGGSGRLPLPAVIARRIRDGEELGPVMDELLNEDNVRQKGGAVGALTAGLIDRSQALAVAVAYAMAPFLAPALYRG